MPLEVDAVSAPLTGLLVPPGDKSITHRALILASLARGDSRLRGLLEAADTRATQAALAQMGAGFTPERDTLRVTGLGRGGLVRPDGALDMGNSGTAMRLLTGVLAGQRFNSVLVGDRSLSNRPMGRIVRPLRRMGACIETSARETAPLVIEGRTLRGIDYRSPVASAQVKSCLLLAGLYAEGTTRVREPALSRDHTERMLPVFGVTLSGKCQVAGGSVLEAADLTVPADPSSAAFSLVAALLVEGSVIELARVGLNPTRAGFLRALEAMGARLDIERTADLGNEPVANIRLRHGGALQAIDLPPAWIPSMIDEIPALMVLATRAEGVTRIRGAAELRVKESDRLAVMSEGLRRLGVKVREYPDGVDITGARELRRADLSAADDHRCAMSFAVLGLTIPGGLTIHGARHIDTSYPGFVDHMNELGAHMAMSCGHDD